MDGERPDATWPEPKGGAAVRAEPEPLRRDRGAADRGVVFRYIDQSDRTISELREAIGQVEGRGAAALEAEHRRGRVARERLEAEIARLHAEVTRLSGEAAEHESRWRQLLASKRRRVLVAIGLIKRTAWESEAGTS